MDTTNAFDYLEHDFFSVEQHLDGKYVHVHGYAYYADSEIESGKPYRGVEYTFFHMPIELFPDNWEKIYEQGVEQRKQYIIDLSEDECRNYLANYYGEVIVSNRNKYGKQPVELDYNEITPDTPVGFYVTK